jgi:hypothetical protein
LSQFTGYLAFTWERWRGCRICQKTV